jgi:cysteine desulfurase/selenocysteine lyase
MVLDSNPVADAAPAQVGTTEFDVERCRAEFPILATQSRGQPLVYLDSAATAQKPRVVIDAVAEFYREHNANIHRGVYQLSEQATLAWDAARSTVARFICAPSVDEVIFVRGTTEAINLVAHSFLAPRLGDNSVVAVTAMEHHANIVPWQLAGATTVPVPIDSAGALDLARADEVLRQRPALFAVTHVSNVLGTINPIAELCRMAHRYGVPVLVDGAQAVPHLQVDVAALDCDFYCFSAHKLFGPTGIGVLWGKASHLAVMPPYQGGGDMIDQVSFESTSYAEVPRRFEAGTPNIAGAVGLAAAIDWLTGQDRGAIHRHETALLRQAEARLADVAGCALLSQGGERAPLVSFTVSGAHPHDIASILDESGVCVRAGHHCTQPLHRLMGVAASVRASFGPYNTLAEVAALADALERVREIFPA